MEYKLMSDGAVVAASKLRFIYDPDQGCWAAGLYICYDHERSLTQVSDDGEGNITALIEPTEPQPPITVSPVEFKLLFTAAERVAIKAARADDPMLEDFYEVLDDPRLTHVNLSLESTQDSLAYLVHKSLITEERKAQISTGVIL